MIIHAVKRKEKTNHIIFRCQYPPTSFFRLFGLFRFFSMRSCARASCRRRRLWWPPRRRSPCRCCRPCRPARTTLATAAPSARGTLSNYESRVAVGPRTAMAAMSVRRTSSGRCSRRRSIGAAAAGGSSRSARCTGRPIRAVASTSRTCGGSRSAYSASCRRGTMVMLAFN